MNNDNKNEKHRLFGLKIRNSRRVTVFVAVLAVLVILLSGFMIYSAAYSGVMPNTYVNSIAVGKMSEEDMRRTLNDSFGGDPAARELTLVCNDTSKTVTFSELEVLPDIDKTAKAALAIGRHGGVFSKAASILKSAFAKNKLSLEINANEERVNSIISEVAAEYETPVKNTSYQLDGESIVITRGEPGREVNRKKALEEIKNAAGNPSVAEIVLKIEDAEPAAVDIDKFYETITQPAQNAYYKKENGNVVVVDDIPQIIVDKSELKKAFASDDAVFRVPVRLERAEKTAQDLKAMLFRDKLSSFSSGFASSSAARATNVTLAASRINGYILMPGEVFSYDSTIGRRTAANGYKEAGVYIGNKVESGIGGGICQTSSTLYSAALYANLEIVQRTSHSLPVSYVPAGQDATIAEGYIDLKLKNNTEYPVKIVASVSGRTVTCSILGVKVPNQTVEIVNTKTGTLSPKVTKTFSSAIPQGFKKVITHGAPGYTTSSKRIVRVNGEVVKTEKLTNSVYNATNTEIEINPADKDTPAENLSVYTGTVAEEKPLPEQANQGGSDTAVPASSDEKPASKPLFPKAPTDEKTADEKPSAELPPAENGSNGSSGNSAAESE